MFLENPISFMENPFGYYIVDVIGPTGPVGQFHAKGPLSQAEPRIRARMKKLGFKHVNLRSHIRAYVR